MNKETPDRKEAAWKKMQPIFAVNPGLAEAAQRWKEFREKRRR